MDAAMAQMATLAPAGYAMGLHIRFTSPLFAIWTYDREWLDHYSEMGWAVQDPIVLWGLTCTGHVRWSDPALADPVGVFAAAASFGLIYGASVATGPVASRSIASLSRADREYTDQEIVAFAAVVQQLHDITAKPANLTKAQVEALRCIAMGDRFTVAAARLGISESALKSRLIGARTALMARTTTEAIQRAKDFRLI
jgi:LuxR family transcriptional regulator, quorum-sensing system regulator SdiA